MKQERKYWNKLTWMLRWLFKIFAFLRPEKFFTLSYFLGHFPFSCKLYILQICYEILTLIMFKGILGFGILIKFSFNHYLPFNLFSLFSSLSIVQVWSVNYTLRFRQGKVHEHCIYWIAFITDIFKKVNLALLAYQ